MMPILHNIIDGAIKSYQEEKLSVQNIANKLGIEYNILYKELIKHIPLRKNGETLRKTTINQEKEIIEKYIKGTSIRKLSIEYGLDRSVFSRILRENNIPLVSNEIIYGKDVDVEEIYKLYKEGKNFAEISRIFKINPITVVKKLRKLDPNIKSSQKLVNKRICTLPDNVQKEICESYLNHKSCSFIAKKYSTSVDVVSRCLRTNNIAIRQIGRDNRLYTINENVFEFEKIHSPEIYIILGLLFTDGTVIWKNKKCFRIELNKKDEKTLDFININIGSNRPLLPIPSKNTLLLAVSNKKMAADLIKLGCIPNKTYCLKFPEWIKDELFSFFLCGCILGDGCISKSKDNNSISLTGTYDFCLGIQEKLTKLIGIKGSLNHPKNSAAWVLTVGGNNQVIKLGNFIFTNAPIIMNRKFEIFKNIIKDKVINPHNININDLIAAQNLIKTNE